MTHRFYVIPLIAALVFAVSGCGTLPKLKKAEYNMGRMAANMGMMAQNMPQMAYTAHHMADTSDYLRGQMKSAQSDLTGKAKNSEKNTQKYLQAYVNNDRDMIKNLKAIHNELSNIKGAVNNTSKKVDSDPSSENLKLLSQLKDLETKLEAAAARLEKIEKRKSTLKAPKAPPTGSSAGPQ